MKVCDGTASGLSGLDPTFVWETATHLGPVDIELGTDIAIRATKDLASLPRAFWGKARKEVAGWGLFAVSEVSSDNNYSSANVEIEASNQKLDFGFKIATLAGKTTAVSRVEARKGFRVPRTVAARVTVNPRYNVPTQAADVVLTYGDGSSTVKLTASTSSQTVTVSQRMGDRNILSPTVTSGGAVKLDWQCRLDKTGSNTVLTTLTPSKSLNVLWKDGPWRTNISAPLRGFSVDDVTVRVRRELEF